MDKGSKTAVNIIAYIITLGFAGRMVIHGWTTLGILFIAVGIIGIIYEAWKYCQPGNKSSSAGAGTAVAAVIIIMVGAYFLVPAVSEEIDEGGVIVPTYSATITVYVDNNHLMVGKDYVLSQDGTQIYTFHLTASQTWHVTKTITWKGTASKNVTFSVTSSGAYGIGDRSDSETVTLYDGSNRTITLYA